VASAISRREQQRASQRLFVIGLPLNDSGRTQFVAIHLRIQSGERRALRFLVSNIQISPRCCWPVETKANSPVTSLASRLKTAE